MQRNEQRTPVIQHLWDWGRNEANCLFLAVMFWEASPPRPPVWPW